MVVKLEHSPLEWKGLQTSLENSTIGCEKEVFMDLKKPKEKAYFLFENMV